MNFTHIEKRYPILKFVKKGRLWAFLGGFCAVMVLGGVAIKERIFDAIDSAARRETVRRIEENAEKSDQKLREIELNLMHVNVLRVRMEQHVYSQDVLKFQHVIQSAVRENADGIHNRQRRII